jgi:hypothetical protein
LNDTTSGNVTLAKYQYTAMQKSLNTAWVNTPSNTPGVYKFSYENSLSIVYTNFSASAYFQTKWNTFNSTFIASQKDPKTVKSDL